MLQSGGNVAFIVHDMGMRVHLLSELSLLLEVVDKVGQRRTIIEGGELGKAEVRLCAAVNVIEGAVLAEGQTIGAGDVEVGAVGGGHGEHRAAATAGGAAQQQDPAGAFEHIWYQIAAGEAVRRNQAEEVFLRQTQIMLVKVAIEVHIYLIQARGYRAGHGILYCDGALTQEGRDNKNRRVRVAAAVVGEIQHHVFNGAALAHDLRVGVEHDADGVLNLRGGGIGVIIRVLRETGKAVKGDVGGVSDLLVDGRAVRIEDLAGLRIGIAGKCVLKVIAQTAFLDQLDEAVQT